MPYNNTAMYLIGCNTNNTSTQTDMRMSSQDNSRILYFAETPECEQCRWKCTLSIGRIK